MVTTALRQEVDTLREYMKELSYQAMRMEMSVARLSDEMRGLKDHAVRTDTAVARLSDEMREFKDEMRGFKDEMQEYKDEGRRERQRMSKQWGELANRLGTLVEDIVAPNLPRVAAELFSCAIPDLFSVRVVRRFGGETREYNALLVCPQVVLVNETKSRLLDTHVDAVLDKLSELPRVFPEYADRRAVGILASLYPEDSVVHRATRKGAQGERA